MTPSTRRRPWPLTAASAALLLVAGCGKVGGGGSSSVCRPFDQLASAKPKDDDPTVAAGRQLATVTNLKGAAKDAPFRLAPSTAPAYQALPVGKTATWGVAVVQLADQTRTLQVDFTDGGAATKIEVSKGSGACVFRVTRAFSSPGKKHVVHFTVLDPAAPPGGPSVDALVDIG